MINIFKCRFVKGVVTRPAHAFASQEFESLGVELKAVILKRFGRSLSIRELDSGSCGACESEIISATNPIYDIQRFGINFVASPRHADALLVTGPVSNNMAEALRKTYDAMPEPKFVVALGECALDGGVFKGSYYTKDGVRNILHVDLHIPGCPPSPTDIIKSLLSFLKSGII